MAHRSLPPDPQVLGALASPLRQDLLVLLEGATPLTAADLARRLGKRPDSLYHHLRSLERVGLVRSLPRRSTGGRPGRAWTTATPLVHVRSHGLTRQGAPHAKRLVSAMVRSSLRDFVRALDGSLDGAAPSPRAARYCLWLNAREREDLVRRLEALSTRFHGREPGAGRTPYVFTHLLAPLEDRGTSAEAKGRSR